MLILIAILLTAAAYFAALQFFPQKEVEETHLPSYMLKHHDLDEGLRRKQFSYSEQEKPFVPLSTKFKDWEKRINLPFNLKRKIVKAGSPTGALEFLLIQLLSVTLLPITALLFLGKFFTAQNLIFYGIVAGLLLPIIWLNKKINKRQAKIRKDLPSVIDLLTICVSGGLDFMLAVNRVTQDFKPCELTRELNEVARETQMGATRREALKNFAWRLDMPEVYSFVRTLIQADRMGTSIGEALKIQAEEMRVRRFQQGEAMALKAPIKLLFPLFVFIMPTVLIIVAGPILMDFMRGNIKVSF